MLAVAAPRLSLLIPVYNEASHLERWCEQLFAFDFGVTTEFLFVDDASTDGSRDILRRYTTRPGMRLLEQPINRGKGAALARAIRESTGAVVIVQDADFEYALRDVPAVIAPILADEADVVYGSRYKSSTYVHRTFHYAVNRAITMYSNVASGLYLSDVETCYKAFRGDLIRGIRLESPRFGFEPEITAKLARLKVRIMEVPISYFPRSYLEGKKITWKDGVAALWHIARFNTSAADGLEKVPDRYKIHRR